MVYSFIKNILFGIGPTRFSYYYKPYIFSIILFRSIFFLQV